jgi:hypothetical protein
VLPPASPVFFYNFFSIKATKSFCPEKNPLDKFSPDSKTLSLVAVLLARVGYK